MKTLMILTLLGIAAVAHGTDMYRWVDEKGVVNYTPYPPPANVKKVEQKKFGGNTVQTSGLPYGVQQAVKNFPVTLYVNNCGDVCDKARAHLTKRGVPFAEVNPQKAEEFENFRKLTGGGLEVPLLVVGQLKTVKGYQATEWDAALDLAGYPSTAIPGAKPAATPPTPPTPPAQPAAGK